MAAALPVEEEQKLVDAEQECYEEALKDDPDFDYEFSLGAAESPLSDAWEKLEGDNLRCGVFDICPMGDGGDGYVVQLMGAGREGTMKVVEEILADRGAIL